MVDDDATNYLPLLPEGTCPSQPPLLHRRRALVRHASRNAHALKDRAIRERLQENVIVRHRKVECPEALVPALIRRGLHDAVDRRLVEPTGEELHRVARIDDECVVDVSHPTPAVVRREYLQSSDRLASKDGNAADVWDGTINVNDPASKKANVTRSTDQCDV